MTYPLIVKDMDERFITRRSDDSKQLEECRICLKKVADIPIFGIRGQADLSLDIMNFGGINLGQNDGFPQYLCVPCYKLLENAVLFRETAKQSDIALKLKKKGLQVTNAGGTYSINPIEFQSKKEVDNKNAIEFKYNIQIDELESDSFQDQNSIIKPDLDLNTSTILVADPNVQFNCLVCKESYKTILKFETHIASKEHKLRKQKNKAVKKIENYCSICNMMFTRNKYVEHISKVHCKSLNNISKDRIECNICKKNLHPDYLPLHMKVQHDEKAKLTPKTKIQCPICNQLYAQRYYKQHYKLQHSTEENMGYMCDQCGKMFTYLYKLNIHRLTHTKALPFKCSYCPYRGRNKQLLKIHVRTHTGDYPYKCTECNVRCITKSNLNSHMKRHRGPVDFLCDDCSRGFYTKLELERHISVKHLGIRNHICKICGMAFGYKRGMVAHTRKVHKVAKGLGKPKASYLKYEEEDQLRNADLEVKNN